MDSFRAAQPVMDPTEAVHNGFFANIDIEEVCGSSPPNPTISNARRCTQIQRFFFCQFEWLRYFTIYFLIIDIILVKHSNVVYNICAASNCAADTFET